ncbi:MAG: DUF354 domain-containing protein [Candidatus Poseidoniales archaeon]
MKIIFVVSHPGHVHFFKNIIHELVSEGHEILTIAVDKEMTIKLLEKFNIDYIRLSSHGQNIFSKALLFLKQGYDFFKIIKSFSPKLVIARSQGFVFQVCKIVGIQSVLFTDTEHAKINYFLALPFANKIVTPSAFTEELGSRQVKYDSYFELSYLSRKVFQPNSQVLDKLNLLPDEKFIILRFVSWKAAHDIGYNGLTKYDKIKLISFLSSRYKVFVSSEKPIEGFETIPIDMIHDAMHYSSLYIGEGATMASECAALGTPSIYINPLSAGTLEEQEKKYKLIIKSGNLDDILLKTKLILDNPTSNLKWNKRKEKMYSDKGDFNSFISSLVQNMEI